MSTPSIFSAGLVAYLSGAVLGVRFFPTIGYSFDDTDQKLSDISGYNTYNATGAEAASEAISNALHTIEPADTVIPSGSGSVTGLLACTDTGVASTSVPLLFWSGSDVSFTGDSSTLTLDVVSDIFMDLHTGGFMTISGIQRIANGDTDLLTDTISLVMMDAGYSFDSSSHNTINDVSASTNGVLSDTLTSPSISGSDQTAWFSSSNTTFSSAASGTYAGYVVIHRESAAATDKHILAYKSITLNGNGDRDVTLECPAEGWFKIGDFG